MGFVGKALPAAVLLLRGGLENRNSQWILEAESVIDFWVANSMNPSGVPRTWYNILSSNADEDFKWRCDTPYMMGHVRIASDGMLGVLAAWRATGGDRPDWLSYTQKYDDFLVNQQAPDGSILGEWTLGDGGIPFTNVLDRGYRSTSAAMDSLFCSQHLLRVTEDSLLMEYGGLPVLQQIDLEMNGLFVCARCPRS